MKLRPETLPSKERDQVLDSLVSAFSAIKKDSELKHFLRTLLTESEHVMIYRRLRIARMLLEGTSYADIISIMHVGVGTVIRVQEWLTDEFPKYETIFGSKTRQIKKGDRGGKYSLPGTPFVRHFFLTLDLPD